MMRKPIIGLVPALLIGLLWAYGGSQAANGPEAPAGLVDVAVRSSSGLTKTVGNVWLVQIKLEGTDAVGGADAWLHFDPAFLVVVDGAGNPTTNPSAGLADGAMPRTFASIDNTTGLVKYSSGFIDPGQSLTTPATHYQIRFRALAPIAGTALTLDAGRTKVIDAATGSLITGSLIGASVQINAVPTSTATATVIPTATVTRTPTVTHTPTPTPTASQTPTVTATPTATATATVTLTPTVTRTPTSTPTATQVPPPTPPAYRSVEGVVWEDVNRDGLWQPGEPPLAGLVLALEGQVVAARHHDASYVAITDAVGFYRFTAVSTGSYILRFPHLPGLWAAAGQTIPLWVDSHTYARIDNPFWQLGGRAYIPLLLR